jgi:hypothetical protein
MPGLAPAQLRPGVPPAPPALHRTPQRNRVMDIERINAIGSNLADLTQRTLDLRGYL